MIRFEHVELEDDEIEAIRAVIDAFEIEDRAVRDRQIRDWKRLELMLWGFNNIYWDYVAHDWRIWGEFPATEIQVDHKKPVVDPKIGFVDWNTYITRMFCKKSNLQVLCKSCHTKKTKKEKDIARKQDN